MNIVRNYTLSIARHIKITNPTQFDHYLYDNYLKKSIDDICKKYKEVFPELAKLVVVSSKATRKQSVLKKADIIRIENTSKNIEEYKTVLFEYILIEFQILSHFRIFFYARFADSNNTSSPRLN